MKLSAGRLFGWIVFSCAFLVSTSLSGAEEGTRLAELDAYWKEVARSVQAGDFEGYKATCHESGVLVSGTTKTTRPLAQALARWKQGFVDTKAGKMKAKVEFRFSERWGDETTARETGIFVYSTVDEKGVRKESYVHFEVLLVKEQGWKTLMEFQKGPATEEEWEKLR